jgi:twinkle protein
MTNAELLQQQGIDLKKHTSGSIKTLCPECSTARKNKKDPSLSVDIDDGLWNCHHCGWKGRVFEKKLKEYVKPAPRLEKLSAKTLEYFEKNRKISNNTLLRLNVTEAIEWMPGIDAETTVICFNYYRGDELVNIKFRGAKKSFKMAKDAELIFYNLNAIEDQDECIIVEGEIDCLSLHEAGIYNSVSVPNGASKGVQKLEYLDNCWELFKTKKKVVLMVDADEAGMALREELARRIGKEVCWKVTMPEGCKDANEILVKYGTEVLQKTVESAIQWPIEGIYNMEDMAEDVINAYENGYPEGYKIGSHAFDKICSFMPGEMTIVTGIPGSGKSEFVDLIMCSLAKLHNWSWGICSFENQPSYLHVTKLLEKITGKAFAFRDDPNNRMDVHERNYGIYVVDKYFHFINISQVEVSLEGILDKAKELVTRKGIKGLMIDPWNYIEHKIPKGYTETQYISECLTAIKHFAFKYGIHIIVIAHPTKIQKDKSTGKYEVPTLYNISGSAHFFNKTDIGITVYRDFSSNLVDVYVQKMRSSWLGRVDFCSFQYNTFTRQYKPVQPEGMGDNWRPIDKD